MITRRDFLKYTLKGAAGLAVPAAAFEIAAPGKLFAGKYDPSGRAGCFWSILLNVWAVVFA